MPSWSLHFTADTAPPLDALLRTLAALTGAPLTPQDGAWSGDPYNGYSRTRRVATRSRDLALEAQFSEQGQAPGDDRFPGHGQLGVTVAASGVPSLLQARETLAKALRRVGYRDETWLHGPRRMVDDVAAAGLGRKASAMRRAITAALVRAAPSLRHVAIGDTCPHDLDAVLRAYTRPRTMRSASLSRIGIDAVPPALRRFPGLEQLTFYGDPLPDGALRGLRLARLSTLGLLETATTRLGPTDLRGFPSLQTLFLAGSPVTALDPDIRDVCPALARVNLAQTPLAADAGTLARLQARWAPVRLER